MIDKRNWVLAIQRYTVFCLRHLPPQRESVTNRAICRRRGRAKPPSYREMTVNAWVNRLWTIQVVFHLFNVESLTDIWRAKQRPIRLSTSTRSTSELNNTTYKNIPPTEKQPTLQYNKQSNDGGQSTHIWLDRRHACRIPPYSFACHY